MHKPQCSPIWENIPSAGTPPGTGGGCSPERWRLLVEFWLHGLLALARDAGAGRAGKKSAGFFNCNVELLAKCGLRIAACLLGNLRGGQQCCVTPHPGVGSCSAAGVGLFEVVLKQQGVFSPKLVCGLGWWILVFHVTPALTSSGSGSWLFSWVFFSPLFLVYQNTLPRAWVCTGNPDRSWPRESAQARAASHGEGQRAVLLPGPFSL